VGVREVVVVGRRSAHDRPHDELAIAMDGTGGSRSGPWGYEIVLVGVVVFVVACFLPYYSQEFGAVPSFTPSLYRVQTIGDTWLGTMGGILFLFCGPAALAVCATFGIQRPRAWTAVAIASITVVVGADVDRDLPERRQSDPPAEGGRLLAPGRWSGDRRRGGDRGRALPRDVSVSRTGAGAFDGDPDSARVIALDPSLR
jgi:hypothetical protein